LLGAQVRENGLAVRKTRLPERRHGDAVVEVERRGQRRGVVDLEILGVPQRGQRETRGLRAAAAADDRHGVGARDEAAAVLDLENAIEDEVDDVVAVERRRTEAGGGGERAQERGHVAADRFHRRGRGGARDEEPVKVVVPRQLLEGPPLLGRELVEPLQREALAGSERRLEQRRDRGHDGEVILLEVLPARLQLRQLLVERLLARVDLLHGLRAEALLVLLERGDLLAQRVLQRRDLRARDVGL